MRKSHIVRRSLLVVAAIVLSSCSQDDEGARVIAESPDLPVAPGETRTLDLSIADRENPAIATSGGDLFVFGGALLDGSGGMRVSNDGVIYRVETGEVEPVVAWPGEPAYQSAVVATGGEYIVIGLPCGDVVPSDEDAVRCPKGELASASYESTRGEWRELASPSEQLDLPTGAHFITGYGASDGVALFSLGGTDAELLGYDVAADRWRSYGYQDADRYRSCFAVDTMYRSAVSETAVATEALDPKSGEWRAIPKYELPRDGESFLQCGWSQPVIISFGAKGGGDGATAMAWLDSSSREWVTLPPPQISRYDGAMTAIEASRGRVFWPSSATGPAQILPMGGEEWMALGAETINAPARLFASGDAVYSVAEPGGTEPARFLVVRGEPSGPET